MKWRNRKLKNIYVYVLDTLADWELGYAVAELNSRQYYKANAADVSVKTVSATKNTITTKGGITILPQCTTDEIKIEKNSTLLLPGADTWSDPKHSTIIEKAKDLLIIGSTVAAICGATSALANVGILDNRPHTSNAVEYLNMTCPHYKGHDFYLNERAVSDSNLITASAAGSLLWAKYIIESLDVFSKDSLEAWYNYYETGKQEYFFALLNTLPQN